jgi:predicted metal-dependent hydrolase
VKEAQVGWIQTKLEDIENHKDQPMNHSRAARELIAGLLKGHHKKTRTIKMMKPNGTLASNQEESAKVFKDRFEKNVFNRKEESS